MLIVMGKNGIKHIVGLRSTQQNRSSKSDKRNAKNYPMSVMPARVLFNVSSSYSAQNAPAAIEQLQADAGMLNGLKSNG